MCRIVERKMFLIFFIGKKIYAKKVLEINCVLKITLLFSCYIFVENISCIIFT